MFTGTDWPIEPYWFVWTLSAWLLVCVTKVSSAGSIESLSKVKLDIALSGERETFFGPQQLIAQIATSPFETSPLWIMYSTRLTNYILSAMCCFHYLLMSLLINRLPQVIRSDYLSVNKNNFAELNQEIEFINFLCLFYFSLSPFYLYISLFPAAATGID